MPAPQHLRIVYLHQYFNRPSDAGGTRSYEMARRLVRAGHRVELVSTRRDEGDGSSNWQIEDVDGIRLHSIHVPYDNRMSYTRRMRAFADFAWAASRRAAAIPADVVFATSTPLTIAIPGIFASRRQRIPMVFEVRDLWPELPIAIGAIRSRPLIVASRVLEKTAYKNSARIVALSPGMAEGVAARGYPRGRIHVIPNSADLEMFDVPELKGEEFRRRHSWLGDRPLIVYLGTLGRINGVDYLARVAHSALLADPEMRFLIVGNGAEQEHVERVARELGVFERNLFMFSPLPKSEMPPVLSAADIATSLFVDLPEMWANSANKFFDALAAGRPVAINYKGWQADLLETFGAGLVIPVDDPDSAASALASAVRNHEWIGKARAAAAALAREQFSRDALALHLEHVLQAAVSERSEGARRPVSSDAS